MEIYKEIKKCRICGNTRLDCILDFGTQALTGVFPEPGEELPAVPVEVVRCSSCGLVQLKHTTSLNLMYGESYGYSSSLNSSMVSHLEEISLLVQDFVELEQDDIILDIGSNDATYLNFFNPIEYNLIGIDPSAEKFKENYDDISLVVDFFSKDNFNTVFPGEKAKIISSLACFYDLENPVEFARETAEILDKDGIWFIEAAYLRSIVNNLCFDGFCHEHLLFYSLKDIKYIMDLVGLKIIYIAENDINGGSFQIAVSHKNSKHKECTNLYSKLSIEQFHTGSLEKLYEFSQRVIDFKDKFKELLLDLKSSGKSVYGLGASTKFNVMLQYCGVDTSLISKIGEVNTDKFGRVTPGTNIPIVPEKEVLSESPDYIIVGPYHFRNTFIKAFPTFLHNGGKLVFPLPNLEIYSKD